MKIFQSEKTTQLNFLTDFLNVFGNFRLNQTNLG